MSLSIDAYLERIDYRGPRDVSPASLIALHRAHAYAIPYENIDVILGRPVGQDPGEIFDKLVTRRRGGWCYEQNGLFAWALQALGFRVTRLCGSVRRSLMGDIVTGNHLVLRVDLDEPWIADVGFGGSFAAPYRLRPGAFHQDGWDFSLTELGNGFWRFSNRGDLDPGDYDFENVPADEKVLADKCSWQQTSPDSNFRKKLICSIATLTGARVLSDQRWTDQDFQVGQRLVADETAFRQVLEQGLGIVLPDNVDGLWDFVVARQKDWEQQQSPTSG